MLIKNAHFYNGESFEYSDILIEDSRIKEIDKDLKVEDEEIFDASNYYLLPGFVNTHTHIPMTLMRGIADELPLDRWLNEVIFPIEAKYINDNFITYGTILGAIELIKSGTTSIVDMYFLPNIVAKALKKIGLRGFIGVGSGNIDKSIKFIEKYKDDNLISPTTFAHAVYTETEEDIKKIKEIADNYNIPYQFHLLETEFENRNFKEKKGVDLLEWLENIGFLSNRLIAAHCVWLSDKDLDILKRNSVTVAHNPNSNLKLNSGIISLKKILDNKINVTLGTDGAASNNQLNMISEMNLAAKLHYHKSKTPAKVNQIFDMATKNAEKSLQKKLGIIKEGYLADLIFVRKDHFSMIPSLNPISNIVYSNSSEAIDFVMINGKWVLKDRKIVNFDENSFIKELQRYLSTIELKS